MPNDISEENQISRLEELLEGFPLGKAQLVMLVLFLWMQREFVEGITLGAVKE